MAGFFSRIFAGQKQAWKYVTRETWVFYTGITGRYFRNEFCELQRDGTLSVFEGYAWDGCSPKWKWLGFYIGTPDWYLDMVTGYPVTAPASLPHDIGCQFGPQMGVPYKLWHRFFCEQIHGTPLDDIRIFWSRKTVADLYCYAVRKWGPQDKTEEELDYPTDIPE